MSRLLLALGAMVLALSACTPVTSMGGNGDVSRLTGPQYLSFGPDGRTPDGYVRIELFTVERNVAVNSAIMGKRPGQWDVAVRDLLFAGKARIADCTMVRVRLSHMDASLPQGPYTVTHVAPSRDLNVPSPIIARSTATLRWVPDAARPERFFMELDAPLVGGNAHIYLPEAAFTASANPVAQFWVPGEELYGLPRGNNTGTLVTTPRNDTFGTENDFVRALGREFKNHSVFMVVRPGACG